MVMQSILRNPLASPFTLGLSNAAAFGASLGILFFQGGVMIGSATAYATISNPLLVTVLAFVFAMAATSIMILLVRVTDCTPETIILAGLAISSIFSAGLAFLQYIADDVALSGIVFWQFGSLSKVTWGHLCIVAVALILAAVYFFYKRWDYNAMEAGEDIASGLGVNVKATRYLGLIASAALTAIVVSFMGVIGFIGLIGPHIVKRVIGNDNRYVLLGSMIVGAMVLLVAYVIGTYAFYTVIPVGIITSAIGGPLFIFILLRGRRRK
jgi:iron complex transport system permease protein